MKKSRMWLFIGVGVIVLILIGFYFLRRSAGPPSITLPIANIKPIEVKATTWVDIYFTLPAPACTLTGHVEGISGGDKDFEGFVMKDDDYRNWTSGQPPQGAASGRVVVWNPNVPLQGLGTYHLVVSNTFSLTTPKMVGVQARVTCP